MTEKQEFKFNEDNLRRAEKILARYPVERKQSAIIPLLDIAQRQSDGWLPKAALDEVARFLGVAPIRIYEVATFYTMFNLKPVGKNFIQVCRTTPCWLRGSDDLVKACNKKLGINIGETTKDGLFTLVEVECLGACANAPMVQINDHYYEDLSPKLLEQLIDQIQQGETPKLGSQTGRQGSKPHNEAA